MTDEFATPDASPRDYVPRGDAEVRAKVPRDQWDRYLMPHLDGTKPARNKGFTRVSTIKSGLSNQTGIKVWTGEKIVEGLGQDTELVEASMRAAKIVDPEDRKRALRKIADRAFVVGGGKDRSGKGTEFHEITEDINRGVNLADQPVDDRLRPDLDAYYEMLHKNGVQILPEYLERQVLCPYNMAGTFDNMVRWWNPDTEEWELCIADLKTGRDLSLGWLEILMQIWSYANAYGLWTTTDVTTAGDGTITDVQGYYEPMPLELRKDKALIFHVPLDGTATLYVLDLSGVERYVAAAVEAKRANAEAKHKVRKIGTVAPAAFVDQHQRFMPGDASLPDQVSSDGGQTWTTAQVGAAVAEGVMAGRRQEADQHSPVRPAEDEYAAREVARRQVTPDQLEQERKRDERLARVAAMSNPNTDDDVEIDAPSVQGQARVSDLPPERDPVTGRKKRTCGHCRKPGHTQKNCPENPASAKYNPQVVRAMDPSPEPADPAAQAYVPESEDPDGRSVLDDVRVNLANVAKVTVEASVGDQQLGVETVPSDLPYCHLAHAHGWTSTHPAAPDQWVCATTGKPSREVYERGQGETSVPLPPAWAAPGVGSQIDYAAVVLGRIASAGTQAELLRLRADAIEAGHWVEHVHNDQAMARYQALA